MGRASSGYRGARLRGHGAVSADGDEAGVERGEISELGQCGAVLQIDQVEVEQAVGVRLPYHRYLDDPGNCEALRRGNDLGA
jgi:hypothetical protein